MTHDPPTLADAMPAQLGDGPASVCCCCWCCGCGGVQAYEIGAGDLCFEAEIWAKGAPGSQPKAPEPAGPPK